MSDPRPVPVRSAEELCEQSAEWVILATLLDRPGQGWRQRLRDQIAGIVDSELTVAVEMAQRERSEATYDCYLGPDGLLPSAETGFRNEADHPAAVADLQSLATFLEYAPAAGRRLDHIVELAGLMAHVICREAQAVSDGRIGEALYLEGIADWLRRGHLAWFTERFAQSLRNTEICYLSHVAFALETRVHPPREDARPVQRPSWSKHENR